MKKRTLTALTLNKKKISELQRATGGFQGASNECQTASGCSCVSCRQGCQTVQYP
jgi:hypothetical protein